MQAANQSVPHTTDVINVLTMSKVQGEIGSGFGTPSTSSPRSGVDGRSIARMIGVTIGVLVLATSSDPLIALVLCLTFWLAGMLLRWPAKVLQVDRVFPRFGFKSVWDMHLWTAVLLLLIMVLFQQQTVASVQFWLLLTAVGYHISRVKLL